MFEQNLVQIGKILHVYGSPRLPYGSQLDFSGYDGQFIGSITIYMEPIYEGDYYAEVFVDDNLIQTSCWYEHTSVGTKFTFSPSLAGGQTYGVRYYRIHDGQRWNQSIVKVIS
jgi:hypothetical protein